MAKWLIKQPGALKKAVRRFLEDASNDLTFTARKFIQRLYNNVNALTVQIAEVDAELNELVCHKKEYERLISVPSVGPIIAATVLASFSDIHSFKNDRQFASWIGLTPLLSASGETSRLGKISNRGNKSLRKLLIHGARTVLNWCEKKDDKLSQWLKALKKRMHSCKTVVAIANKLARIIWSVLVKEVMFDVNKACA